MSASGGVGDGWRFWLARVRELGRQRAREAQGACIAEGVHAVQQAADAGLVVEAVLACPDRIRTAAAAAWLDGLGDRGIRAVRLRPAQFERLVRARNPAAVLAVVRWRPRRLVELEPARVRLAVVAEELDDAGNLGSLIRTADAAGADLVVAVGGTDPAQHRCLRASLGTAFRIPVARAPSAEAALSWAKAAGCALVGTSPAGAESYASRPYPERVAVVFGNERRGLRPETLAACERRVRVPLHGSADSLNVTVAAGVVLFEVRRRTADG